MPSPTPNHQVAVCFIDALDAQVQQRASQPSAFTQLAAGFRTKWEAGLHLDVPLGTNPYLDQIASTALEAMGTTWGDSELFDALTRDFKQRVDVVGSSPAHRDAAVDVLARWPGGDRDTFLREW